ncbi:putative quinol monooxygenase [Hahella ganghwensis]|uniref:putative quinol monooxygenase n=1 Tax=Hahella ganghwensis TaxID=286420 RepID=UPI00039E1350|nr:antibiotic biosynthesis monooxygenase [Hahella ganghwensis]
MTAYYLTAHIRVINFHQLNVARSELKLLQQHTREEPGCIEFRFLEDREHPGDFWLWEVWNGEEGLQAHLDAPHTKRYFGLGLTDVLKVTKLDALEEVCL